MPESNQDSLRDTTASLKKRIRDLEAALAKSETKVGEYLKYREYFKKLYEDAPLAYQSLDIHGHVLSVNGAWLKMLGYTADEVIGHWCGDFIAPQYIDCFKERFQQFVKTGIMQNIRYDMRHKDGHTVAVEVDGRIGNDDNGNARQTHCILTDITQKEIDERNLKASEEKYRLLVENQNDLVVKVDGEGRFLFVSPSYCQMFDKTEDELLGKTFMPLVNEDDPEATAQAMEDLKKPPYTCHVEQRTMTRYGWRWLAWADKAILDERQQVSAIIGVGRDITKWHESNEALQESERRLATLMANIPGMVYWCRNDKDWTMEFVSDACRELTGYSPEELLGSSAISFNDLIHPDDRERVWRIVQESIDNNLPFQLQYRIITRNGLEKWVWEQGRLVSGENDQCQHLEGLINDVTARVKAKEDLYKSEERFRRYFEIGSIGMAIATPDQRWSVVNDHMCSIYGYSRDEMVSKTWSEMMPPEDFRRNQHQFDLLLAGDIDRYSIDVRFFRKNGEIMHANIGVSCVRLHDGSVDYILGFIYDQTRQKRLEAELTKAEKLESIGVLAGGIAHDFNNIMTTVLGNISLARMDCDMGTEVDQLLGDAEMAIVEAKGLTQQLLTFSQGGAPILKTTTIAGIIQNTVDNALRASHAKYDRDIPDDLLSVDADEDQLAQVINNLITNADQSMPGGGTIHITGSNEAVSRNSGLPITPGTYVKISIRDEGTGIPQTHFHKIFDPFFTTKPQGNGLGLATAYSIIKKHKGHLLVESEVNHGSIFTIYLPASSKVAMPQPEKDDSPPDNPGNILVVDDEESIRKLVKVTLSRMGYTVTLAQDGAEAVDMYRQAMVAQQPFAAVMVDLTIPGGMGGKETLRRLREIDPASIVVVSSGYSNDPVMADYAAYGFNGCVSKPYRASDLGRAIKKSNQGASLPD